MQSIEHQHLTAQSIYSFYPFFPNHAKNTLHHPRDRYPMCSGTTSGTIHGQYLTAYIRGKHLADHSSMQIIILFLILHTMNERKKAVKKSIYQKIIKNEYERIQIEIWQEQKMKEEYERQREQHQRRLYE